MALSYLNFTPRVSTSRSLVHRAPVDCRTYSYLPVVCYSARSITASYRLSLDTQPPVSPKEDHLCGAGPQLEDTDFRSALAKLLSGRGNSGWDYASAHSARSFIIHSVQQLRNYTAIPSKQPVRLMRMNPLQTAGRLLLNSSKPMAL